MVVEQEPEGEDERIPECALGFSRPTRWNAFQAHICKSSEGRDWYNNGGAHAYWVEHLQPAKKQKLGATARPKRWLRCSAEAERMGAHRVLIVEAKWERQWNIEEVKYQAVSYVCSLTHT